jgi:lysophospholipase L1-like esterase
MRPIDRRRFLLAGLGGFTALAAACAPTGERPTLVEPEGGDLAGLAAAADRGTVAGGAAPTPAVDLVMVGDSLTVAATPALEVSLAATGLTVAAIDAQVGRRMNVGTRSLVPGADVIRFVAAGSPPDVWVVALGTNDLGQFDGAEGYRAQLELLLAELPAAAPLVWVDTWFRARAEESGVFNLVLRDVLGRRDAAVVVDWAGVAEEPGVLTSDGVHTTPSGAERFAEVVAAGVEELLADL